MTSLHSSLCSPVQCSYLSAFVTWSSTITVSHSRSRLIMYLLGLSRGFTLLLKLSCSRARSLRTPFSSFGPKQPKETTLSTALAANASPQVALYRRPRVVTCEGLIDCALRTWQSGTERLSAFNFVRATL